MYKWEKGEFKSGLIAFFCYNCGWYSLGVSRG